MEHAGPFAFLAAIPRSVACRVLDARSPDEVALALAYLEPAAAAELLDGLANDQLGRDAALELGHLRFRDNARARGLAEQLAQSVRELETDADAAFDGEDFLIKLLRRSRQVVFNDDVISYLDRTTPHLAARVRRQLIPFDALVYLDDDDLHLVIQRALWSGDGFFLEDLGIALQGAPATFVERVALALPRENADAVRRAREELVVKAARVREARATLLALVRGLVEAGEIELSLPES